MIIACDFDGTIVTHEYPKIGKPIPFAIQTLKKLIASPKVWSSMPLTPIIQKRNPNINRRVS